MKVLLLYLKQRFNPAVFGGLTLLLILFSVPKVIGNAQVFLFVLPVFLFLGILRLYDDLMSYKIDAQKPNRIYTLKESRNLLALILAGFAFLFLLALFFLHPITAGALALFLIVNDLLYRLFFNKSHWKNFLPLLKYPAMVSLLYFLSTPQFSWLKVGCLAISIFSAFIVFEQLDDKEFPVPKKYTIVFASLSLIALLVPYGHLKYWWVSLLILATGSSLIYLKHKSVPYLFIGFILLSKLVMSVLI